MEELRGLYVTLALSDKVTPHLKRVNTLMNESAKRMAVLEKSYLYSSAAFEKSLATTAHFFAQVDRIERQAYIQSKHQHAITQKLALSYYTLRKNVMGYASTIVSQINKASLVLEKHRMLLIGIGTAMSGAMGLSLRAAVNEEKYRKNIESLVKAMGYRNYELERGKKEMNEFIDAAAKLPWVSKETRAHLISEMALMGVHHEAIKKYIPIIEKYGVATGRTSEEILFAIKSGMSGLTMALHHLGLTSVTAEAIAKKMREIKERHSDWTDEAIRAQAVLEVAIPLMKRQIGDFKDATDSTWASLEMFKEKLSDLTGDIGALYAPAMRLAADNMRKFVMFLNDHPVLQMTISVGLLSSTAVIFGGLALPKVIQALKWWKSLTIWHTVAQSRLATVLKTRVIPAMWGTLAPLLPYIAIIGAVVGAILLLQHAWVHNWLGIRDKTLAAINAIRGAIDWLLNGIRSAIEWIQKLYALTPMGMGIKAATTLLTEHRLPTMGEILPTPSQLVSTSVHKPTYIEHKQVNIPKIEIKVDGAGDPDKVADRVMKKLQLQFRAAGV